MIIGELIEELQRFDPMQTVYVPDACGADAFAKLESVRVLFDNGGSLSVRGRGEYPRQTNCIGLTAGNH